MLSQLGLNCPFISTLENLHHLVVTVVVGRTNTAILAMQNDGMDDNKTLFRFEELHFSGSEVYHSQNICLLRSSRIWESGLASVESSAQAEGLHK